MEQKARITGDLESLWLGDGTDAEQLSWFRPREGNAIEALLHFLKIAQDFGCLPEAVAKTMQWAVKAALEHCGLRSGLLCKRRVLRFESTIHGGWQEVS